jgi:hypothetical protein
MPNNIINASSAGSGGLITTAADSGSLEIQSNGTTIMTIGSTGVTTQVGAPAFSVYRSGSQTLSTSTLTKIQYNAENFDTNSNFDSTTNYRFTPTVAGYYQINYQVGVSTTACNIEIRVVKNGDTNAGGGFWVNTSAVRGTGSNVIYCNGSTDYLEIYATISSGQTLDSANTYFSGFLARSA